MITELLAIAALSRKLWKRGTVTGRVSAVGVWVAFGAAVPFLAQFIEATLPTAVIIAMPCTTVSATVAHKVFRHRHPRYVPRHAA